MSEAPSPVSAPVSDIAAAADFLAPFQSLSSVVSSPLSLSVAAPAASQGFLASLNNLAAQVTGAAKSFYQTQAEIEAAKASAQIARAQGANAVQVARTGTPSLNVMLLGGAALVAVFLVMDRSK